MNEELYKIAINMPFVQKVDKAIKTIREFEPMAKDFDFFEKWYHLCDSYGKDSCVVKWLMERAGVEFKSYHSLTTIDAPELIHFGKKYHPETIIIKPEKPLLKRMVEDEGEGPPTRLVRWCCELYKENGCWSQFKVFGVRAEESAKRKQNWKILSPIKRDKSLALNPILYWTEDDVWKLIHDNNIPYCSLYDEGFKRLGCVGCPMAGKGRIKEFERYPKIHIAWQKAFKRFWEKWHNVPLLRPRWVSTEGKYPFLPISGEKKESRYVEKTEQYEKGFWTLRRWY
ncbi:MAG: phosphoadenosine phosphosulfate reductase family protein, partial [Alphaproteobacteria bacterium]